MTKFRYTDEQLEFIQEGYMLMPVEFMAAFFNLAFRTNKTPQQLRACLKNHKITCGRKGNDRMVNRTRLFTEIEKDFIREQYKERPLKDIPALFMDRFGKKVTVSQIRSCTRNHQMKSGRTGCFEKGNQSWNAGTKGQGLTGANRGSFKKGNVPANCKPLYTERISKDGFIEIKVPERNPHTGFPTRYRHKHRWVWEQTYGPIPEDMVVAFRDSDPMNCDPENMMLLSRSELLQINRHGYREMPADLKPSVLALSKLQVKTRESIKESA